MKIVSTFRSSPLTSASSVILLVSPDVDALCATRMLSDLLKQDDVIHRIIPVCGFSGLEQIRLKLLKFADLHTLILLNIGGLLELTSEEWFGSFTQNLTVHVIDSIRPLNLESLLMGGKQGESIVIWDDGGVEVLQEVIQSWEALTFHPDNDERDSYSEHDETEKSECDSEYDESNHRKRRAFSMPSGNAKRKRLHTEEVQRISPEELQWHEGRIEKYYAAGTYHSQSAASTIYILATILERVDNDMLWFSIIGLTYQFINSQISRDAYENSYSIHSDEVSRLNPSPSIATDDCNLSLPPNDSSLKATNELRFMHFRHWTLYDAMYHSSYVANKLGLWKERGRKRLTGLLAKMGFSISQTQQPFSHMGNDLKMSLLQKLEDVAPEYGLTEYLYPSFMRCYGYRSQPLSAADAVESINALLDVASGTKMEIHTEGTRNGGEWFGGSRVWEANAYKYTGDNVAEEVGAHEQHNPIEWWVKNFWIAFDALDDVNSLREALKLSMSLHQAIIRQGSSIIDKQDIRTMRNHRVVVISHGADLALFSHPSILSRLALWLVDALRDRLPETNLGTQSSRKSLPFVIACLNESAGTYMVVGITAALNFGDVRKNEFGLAFLSAKEKCNTVVRHTSFDASVLEIEQKNLKAFLNALCEWSG